MPSAKVLLGMSGCLRKTAVYQRVHSPWLINYYSAGIFEPKWSSFLYDTEDEFYMQMRVNAEHPLKLTRIAMRSLLGANKPGVVCLISSGAGLTGIYSAALYCATK